MLFLKIYFFAYLAFTILGIGALAGKQDKDTLTAVAGAVIALPITVMAALYLFG